MKVALLGATGFVGSALLNEALDRGHVVTAIVRDGEKLKTRGSYSEGWRCLRYRFSCDADPRTRSCYQRLQRRMEEPEPL